MVIKEFIPKNKKQLDKEINNGAYVGIGDGILSISINKKAKYNPFKIYVKRKN